jgi:hypothetical protein
MVWELTFGIYLIAKGFTAPETRKAPEVGTFATTGFMGDTGFEDAAARLDGL